MAKGVVKNQHYIPESLLRNFTNSKGNFFEVFLPNKKIYSTKPISSMCANYIYEDDHLRRNTIEKYFGKIESVVAPLVTDLIKSINDYKKGYIKYAEIKTRLAKLLPEFITFYYRSGALLTEFSSIDSKDKIPLLSKKILNQYYINILATTIQKGYQFAILEYEDSFILSDQFISTAALKIKSQFANISNRHIGIKETLILIPISSNYYAVYWHTDSSFFLRGDTLHQLNKDEAKQINQVIINNSYQKSVCEKRESIEEVLKNYHMEFPSQIYIGHNSGSSSGYIKKKEVFFNDLDRKAFEILSDMINIKEYMEAGRNDKCPCKSGKKFKKCHELIIDRIKIPIYNLKNQRNIKRDIFAIPNVPIVEKPIDEWGPMSRSY